MATKFEDSMWYWFLIAFIGAVVYRVIVAPILKMERFDVPVKPSHYQDQRYVTPAGNTIVY